MSVLAGSFGFIVLFRQECRCSRCLGNGVHVSALGSATVVASCTAVAVKGDSRLEQFVSWRAFLAEDRKLGCKA